MRAKVTANESEGQRADEWMAQYLWLLNSVCLVCLAGGTRPTQQITFDSRDAFRVPAKVLCYWRMENMKNGEIDDTSAFGEFSILLWVFLINYSHLRDGISSRLSRRDMTASKMRRRSEGLPVFTRRTSKSKTVCALSCSEAAQSSKATKLLLRFIHSFYLL